MKMIIDRGIRITITGVENIDIGASLKRGVDATRIPIKAVNDADHIPGLYPAQAHLKADAGITDPVGNEKKPGLHLVLQNQRDLGRRSQSRPLTHHQS